MLRFLRPGDRFAFEISPNRYGQGTLLAKTSLGHFAEFFPDVVSDPNDMSAWDNDVNPTFVDILDSYSLFDRRREGNWQRIATDAPVPERGVHRALAFGYGSPGDRYRVDMEGEETAIDEEDFARLPRYRPAGHKTIAARFDDDAGRKVTMTDAKDRWELDSLDGSATTLVSHRIGDWDVMVGGGPDVFIVTAQTSDLARVANALSEGAHVDPDDDDAIELTVGGQAVDYPRPYVLDRPETLRALDDLSDGAFPVERWEILGDV